jgi:hypothetical protein
MHAIAILIVTLLLLIPAALAGIISGLAYCLSHRPDFTAVSEHATALIEAVGPFGTGLMLTTTGIILIALTIAIAINILARAP